MDVIVEIVGGQYVFVACWQYILFTEELGFEAEGRFSCDYIGACVSRNVVWYINKLQHTLTPILILVFLIGYITYYCVT